MTADRQIAKWIGTLTDIEDQRRLEQSLRAAQRESAESHALLEMLQAAAPAGFGFVDRDFRVVHINETLAKANGVPREQQLGHRLAEIMPQLWSALEAAFRRVLETGQAELHREIERELPGDPGRVLFTELERVLHDAARDHRAGALLTLDVDNLRATNDTHGYAAGDRLLRSVAEVLTSRFPRTRAMIARIGGDEFAMVLSDASRQQAGTTAAELRDLLREHPTWPVRVSIGIAAFDGADRLTADKVLAGADSAMYQAKAAGGDQAIVHASGSRNAEVLGG